MVRAYFIYVVMALVFGAGLWAIIGFGRSLEAVRDISGDWEVTWTTDAPAFSNQSAIESASGDAGASAKVRIEQSGRFRSVRLDPRTQFSMKMTGGTYQGSNADPALAARLSGDDWVLEMRPMSTPGEMQLAMRSSDGTLYRGIMQRRAPLPDDRTADDSTASPGAQMEAAHAGGG